MEKDGFLGSNGSSPAPASMTDQLGCFVNLNWDQSLSSADQTTANFESALSSLVSSPTSSTPNAPSSAADSLVIRELIGRLGSICNSSGGGGEISPPNSHQQSASASCYSTPLNSPPKLNLSLIDHQQQQLAHGLGLSHPLPFATDPGFVERAARYSCFGARNYDPHFGPGLGLAEPGKLSRAPSSQSLKHGAHNPQMGGNGVPMQRQDSQEASGSEGNVRKRKAAACSKGSRGKDANASKTPEDESLNAKRSKSVEAGGAEKEKKDKEENAKPLEPPKQDFIHVRARRGQATDSHSLAERVRREKISERMKFLQDLVPGCNKVTGKAVMLDEIINYVQSLQRQVEFLSMKLATVNPRLDFNPDNLLSKAAQQTCGQMQPHLSFPMEATSTGFSYAQHPQGSSLQSLMANSLENQCLMNPLDAHLRRSLSMQLPSLEGFTDASSQLGAFWEDDLQSVVQMGFGQNQETVFSSQNFQGSLLTNHMKVEL